VLGQGCRGSAVLLLPGGLNTGSVMNTLNSRADATLGALFLEFAKIGLCGFGSLLAWAHRVIVDERHWMSEAEFADTLSLCLFLPGPENANISIYVGSKFRGPVGATVALLGLTAAPLAVGLVLGILYLQHPHLPVIQNILGGIAAAAAGMLIATGIKMLMPHRRRPTALFFAMLAFAGIIVAKLPLLAVLAGLVPLSIAVAGVMSRRAE
jgi:chromate transporter